MEQALELLSRFLTTAVEEAVEKSLIRVLEKKEQESKPEKLYTRAECAAMLNVSKVTLWNMAKSGRLHPVKVGAKRVMYRESEISALIKND